ncbi:MAG: hypothetical protein K2X35_04740 [Bryobacteraceae bacterium]|nr:hypothetical protein [Bryobacteraceae bacterium]
MKTISWFAVLAPVAALVGGAAPTYAQSVGYARTLTTDGTTIDVPNSLNPSGGAITSVRNSLGNYNIRYAGALTSWREFVSALGSGAEYCKVGDSGGSAASYDARVLCFTATGAPTETRYAHMVITPNNPQQISYAWIAANGVAHPTLSWTPTGQVTAARTGTGTYTVTFPGMTRSDNVQVSAYGPDNTYCYPVEWTTLVNVRCVNPANVAVDAFFNIAYVKSSAQPGLGFMWLSTAESTGAATTVTPQANYRYNSGGGTIEVTRTGVGLFSVRFAGINPSPAPGGKGPAAQIIGYGGSALRCSVDTITQSGADVTVNAACFAAGGAPANGPFTLLLLPPQQTVAPPPGPTPTISSLLTSPNPPLAGSVFSLSIAGTNFDPATVRVLFTSTSGGTCTAASPCAATLSNRTATSISGSATLPAGTYSVSVVNATGNPGSAGTITVATPGGGGGSITVTPSTLAFQFRTGGPAPPAQTIQIPGRAAGTAGVRTFTVDFPSVPWLTVSPASGEAPNGGSAALSVTLVTASLPAAPGTVDTNLRIRLPGDNATVDVPVAVAIQDGGPTASNTNQVLSHIADSEGWQTTIILMNPDPDPAPFTLRFYGSQTTDRAPSAPLDLALEGVTGRASVIEGTIPGRGSRTIQTAGTDASLNMGWVELVSARRIVGSSVFRYTPDRQEAAVNLTAAARSFVMPFDNTQGRVTSFALINTNAAQAIAVNVTVRDEGGTSIGSTSIPLLARGHIATESNTRFPASANRRGTLEFTTTQADITGLGIRFDTAAPGARPFTSFPVHPRP